MRKPQNQARGLAVRTLVFMASTMAVTAAMTLEVAAIVVAIIQVVLIAVVLMLVAVATVGFKIEGDAIAYLYSKQKP